MHYFFYMILLGSLKLGFYTNTCLPFSWEEGSGPVSHVTFIICGIKYC